MRRMLLSGLALSLVAALIWMLFFWQPDIRQSQEASGSPIAIAEAPKGGDFVLNSYKGKVDLKSLRGEVVVLYFGYTWCPDVCPTSLGLLSAALDQLTPEEQSRVQALFISVDPARDTLQRLKSYGEYFHPRILGVTGSPEQLARVAKLYGAAYRQVKQKSSKDYVIDHSADLYVIDQKGALHSTIRHGTKPSEILAVLRSLLNKNQGTSD